MLLKNVNYIDGNYNLKKDDFFIKNGIVEKIGKLNEKEYECEKFDLKEYIVMPGFINAHVHTPDTIVRGIFKDCELSNWFSDTKVGNIQKKICDYIDNSVNTEDFETMALYTYIEYIKQGIIFVVESGQADYSAEALEKSIEKIGLKAIVDVYDELNLLYKNRRLEYGIHFPEEEDVTTDEIIKVKNAVKDDNPFVMTHCLETKWRKEEVFSKFDKSTVEILNENNLLHEKTILFHCVHVDKKDIKSIAEKKSNIAYCPVSNMWSSAGEAPIKEFLESKVNLLLATDFIYNDFWEVVKITYYKLKSIDINNEYSIKDVFRMITENGEKIGGITNYSGIIKEGKAADLIFIKKDNKIQPLIQTPEYSNVLHNILIHSDKEMIKHVMINGKFILKNRKILTVNEVEINKKYSKICNKMKGIIE